MSAHRTSQESQSLLVACSSPPTYWIGFCTLGSKGSRRSNTDSTGICPDYGRSSSVRTMSELTQRLERATAHFGDLVQKVGSDQWESATPCSDWDVRALVNHLVYEARWAPPLLAGRTIADVGDQFDGDLLGAD